MKDNRVLLKELKFRNEEALKATIFQYTPYISSIIYGILIGKGTYEDVEEIVSDTFLALWKSADHIDYKNYNILKPYIGMIA